MEKTTKHCNKCKNIKDISEFYICQGMVKSYCKACIIRRNTNYQKKNDYFRPTPQDKEVRNQYMKEYRDKNREKFRQYYLNQKEKYPEYKKLRAREYRERKRSLIKESEDVQ